MRTMRGAVWLVVASAMVAGWVATAGAAESPTERRLRMLEEQLRKAQSEIDRLRGEIDQQKAVGQATQRQAEQAQEDVKSTATASKRLTSLPDWLDRTTIFGDVRARHEGFYHQPSKTGGTSVNARNRERVRARLGVRVAFSDEISATIRGASGNANDPISTNETLTGNFNRKNFNLDWAYVTLAPGKTFNMRPGVLSMTAGKFPTPTFKVGELVFDEDLSPEGFAETVQLLDKPIGILDQVKIHGLQWTFNEVANMEDGWMFGGQVNPTLHVGDVTVDGGVGQYWWLNPDSIAVAGSRNSTSFTSSGAPVANSNFNSSLVETNLVVMPTIQPPTPAGGKKPASFTAITGFQSGFNQTNVTLGATVPNVVFNQPLRLFADYVYNWQAVNSDSFGWQMGARLGQTKARGDWSVYGLYEQLEQDATISAFTWSDFGPGGTNVQGAMGGVDYQLLNPLTLSARSWFTNAINRSPDFTNPTQIRLQLDAIVKF